MAWGYWYRFRRVIVQTHMGYVQSKLKKFDLLYANGCSFVQGSELNGLALGNRPYSKINNRFTEIISEKVNIPYINDAIGGSGNDKIIRRTYEFIKDKSSKKVIVVLGLSGLDRYEIWSPIYDEYLKFNLSHYEDDSTPLMDMMGTYIKYFHDKHNQIEKLHRELTMLQAYIKSVNNDNELIVFSSLCNGIEHFKDDFNYIMFDEFSTWNDYNRKHKSEYKGGHPNEESHHMLSEKIIKIIEKKT